MKNSVPIRRTMVGIPLYDGESPRVLRACLANVDECLNSLGIDAKIVIGINGPLTSKGLTPDGYTIDRSLYHANVEFVQTRPGMVSSIKAIGKKAEEEGYGRIFLTDADIYRFPQSLKNMWHSGERAVVGATYSTYPSEVLDCFGVHYTPMQKSFIRIFEADKHPDIRGLTAAYRPKTRLKGSLLLINTDVIWKMFGDQTITTDSRMNEFISDDEKQWVREAVFMYYARTDLTDYLRARLRHFRAAFAVNNLQAYAQKELMYDPQTAHRIANTVFADSSKPDEVAAYYLLQTALRYRVGDICTAIALGKRHLLPGVTLQSRSLTDVRCLDTASDVIVQYLQSVDWDSLRSPVTKGLGTTQNNQNREPLNLGPLMEDPRYRQIIYGHLGLDPGARI